ncbi:hypothetical protein N7456_005791 [Penicillium angulare]|uniref:Alkyl transferase n=1 Tax=Penicillium angulare TaxID=116970 RepID=A0A9W9FZ67_9EURO|nr:hypothetical protein N7456_005791 [Penicillium angulare]
MASHVETVLSSLSPQVALINTLRQGSIPNHIGFIMDGNRRWANSRGFPVAKGHYLGSKALLKTVESCLMLGVKSITMYAFSIENFNRSNDQVHQLMALFKFMLIDYSRPGKIADQYNMSIRVVGRLDLLDDDFRKKIDYAIKRTGGNTNGVLNLCVAYTSRDEVSRAMKETVHQCCEQGLPVESITDKSIAAHMDVTDDIPVDIVVRTSRVQRLSDFLLWQSHRDTDIQIVDVLWPDFDLWQLFLVILRWQRKQDGFEPARASGISVPFKLFSCILMTILLGLCIF